MIVELRHIRYFLAVAEEQHFTKAAVKVGIGQPPLSQQIKDLEGGVGAALFHRLAHGAELTEAGKAFWAGVKEMPLIAKRATMAARRGARGETGSLRVGYTASAAFNVVVPSAIRAFRGAYPEKYDIITVASKSEILPGDWVYFKNFKDYTTRVPDGYWQGENARRRHVPRLGDSRLVRERPEPGAGQPVQQRRNPASVEDGGEPDCRPGRAVVEPGDKADHLQNRTVTIV